MDVSKDIEDKDARIIRNVRECNSKNTVSRPGMLETLI
jgi:hypothetical protein